ncbi:hypothetical protein ACQ4M3_03675 [Leptolyngbya sp. AN03gr2]|uniref:hypothetical protein n=1 Tax=unclassified Leptolyngbya TaxID=2650499 RepID=UPI003D31699B
MILSVKRAWAGWVAQGMIASIALAGVIGIQIDRLKQPSISLETPQQAEQQERLRLNLLSKMPTFGFDNLMANWTFLNFIQYYGDTPAREVTGFSLSSQYFDLITRHDPRFVESYLFLSGTVSHQLGKPELALELMKRGTDALSPQIHPKAFSVWRWKAMDQILLLGDLPGAAKSFDATANWAAQSEEYKQFAPSFQETANFLRTNPDIGWVRFQAWSLVYQDADAAGDKLTRDRAKRELLKLGAIERQNENGETVFIAPKELQQPKPRK